MFLKEFSSTAMQKETKSVFETGNKEDILLTRRGDNSLVAMSKERYTELMAAFRKANADK